MKQKKETAGKTAKTNDIVAAFRLINPAKLSKMESAERFPLILAIRQLKKVATDFDDFLKDVQERLKPEAFDAIAAKVQSQKELSKAESDAWTKYQKDIQDCLHDELEKQVDLDFKPLSEDAIAHFIDSNDFSAGDIILILDILGE